MSEYILYKLTCVVNNKGYVGLTTNLNARAAANNKGYVRSLEQRKYLAKLRRGKKLSTETIARRTATRTANRLAKLNVFVS